MKKSLSLARRGKLPGLIIGIIALAVAAVGINFVIEQNNQTEQFLVATKDLPAGSLLTDTELKSQSANLGSSGSQYLSPTELPPGSYLLSPIRTGQLVARSMVATAIIDDRVPVVIDSQMALPAGLVAGASVDIWVVPKLKAEIPSEPYALVTGAEVARLIESSEMFASANPAAELWVPLEAVSPILNAIAAEDAISLILRPTLADHLSADSR